MAARRPSKPASCPAAPGPRRRHRRRGRRVGSQASWPPPAPCPGCPGLQRREGPTGSRQASRTGPRRPLPRTGRGQAAQAQAPAWGRPPAMCLLVKAMTHLLWPRDPAGCGWTEACPAASASPAQPGPPASRRHEGTGPQPCRCPGCTSGSPGRRTCA